jgi:hypothetical protein
VIASNQDGHAEGEVPRITVEFAVNSAPARQISATRSRSRFFGVLGYVLVKCGCEPAPLLLGFVLGPLLEENLRRALSISRGDPSVFVTRPISAVLLALALAALVLTALPAIRRRREVVFQEEGLTDEWSPATLEHLDRADPAGRRRQGGV